MASVYDPHRDTRLAFPSRGSWEFVALKVEVDGEYQASLFRFEYWLSRTARATTNLNSLVAFVHGTHTATLALERVVARSVDGALLTYPIFDARKNAVVARMRFQAGLEVLDKVIRSGKRPSHAAVRGSRRSRKVFDELLPRVHELRESALAAVIALLPEMRVRSDEHVDAFVAFFHQHSRVKRSSTEDEGSGEASEKPASYRKRATAKTKKKKSKRTSASTA